MNNPVVTIKKLAPRQILIQSFRELIGLGADNPSMPETIFRSFLQALYNPETDKFNTTLWFHTFGTTRKGVDIHDPAGRVLFTCPSIMGTVATRNGVPTNESLSLLGDLAALNQKRHARLAENTMKEGLANYELGQAVGVRTGWVNILRRYNMLPTSIADDSETSVAGNAKKLDLLTGPEEEL